MPAQESRYLSFLLRCWEGHLQASNQSMTWRFSLEDVATGERRGFPDLAALVAFLQTQLERPPPNAGPEAGWDV